MSSFSAIIIEVIGITAPVFVVVAIGFLIKRRGFITEENVPVLNRLTYNLGLSALVFRVISGSRFSDIFDVNILKVIFSTYFSFMFLVFISFYFSRLDRGFKGAVIVSSYRNNMAFIGLPILLYAFGSIAAAKAGIVIAALLPLNIISTALFFYLFRKPDEDTGMVPVVVKKISVSFLLREIFTDPVIIAVIAGILLSYFEVSVPGPVDRIFEILAGIAVPLALISIGASFKFNHIRNNLKYLSVLNVLKLLVFPAIALLFSVFVFKIDAVDRNTICILFATPVAVATYIQSRKYRTDHDFVSSAIITTTLISAVTLSAWLFILKLV